MEKLSCNHTWQWSLVDVVNAYYVDGTVKVTQNAPLDNNVAPSEHTLRHINFLSVARLPYRRHDSCYGDTLDP